MNKIILFLVAIIVGFTGYTATITAGTGAWASQFGSAADGDVLVIPSGATVSIKNGTIDLTGINVTIIIEDGGTLELERTGNGGNISFLQLSSSSTIELEDGGLIDAVSNKPAKYNEITIEVGGVEVWDGSDGDITNEGTLNGNTVDGNLPVELASYTVIAENNSILIGWSTFTEVNNNYFTIEHSADGRAYELLTSVSGTGNSNQLNNYKYTVSEAKNGTTYYRLSQTDFDGSTKVLGVRSLAFSGEVTQETTSIYPNPVTSNRFWITNGFNSNPTIQLINILGGAINILAEYNTNNIAITIPTSTAPGVYILNATDGIESHSEKVIIK